MASTTSGTSTIGSKSHPYSRQFNVPVYIHEVIKRLSDAMGRSQSMTLRRMMGEYFERHPDEAVVAGWNPDMTKGKKKAPVRIVERSESK